MKFRTLFATATAVTILCGPSHSATIDLGFVLDSSASVAPTDFAQAASDLADALVGIPTSGANTYRVAVTNFSSSVRKVVEPTVVTADNIGAIQDAIRNASYLGSSTNTAGAISVTFGLFEEVGLGDTTLLNISSDGQPDSQRAAESAAIAANSSGLDGLGFEMIGSFNSFVLSEVARIASLGTTGVLGEALIVDDVADLPDVTEMGFVLNIDGFDAYGAAIGGKVGRIIDDTGGNGGNGGNGGDGGNDHVIPLPASLPMLMLGLAGIGVLRRRRGG